VPPHDLVAAILVTVAAVGRDQFDIGSMRTSLHN